MLKKLTLGTLLFAFGVIAVYAVIRVVGGEEITDAFFSFTPWGIIPILILTIINAVISVWRWQLILRQQGHDIKFRALTPIWLAGYAFSYLTPIVYMGGEGIRTYLLKERHNVDWHVGSASIFLDKIINGTVVAFIILLSIGVFIFFAGLPELTKMILGAISSFLLFISVLVFIVVRSIRNESVFYPIVRFFSWERTKLGKFLIKFEKELQDFLSLRSRAMWEALGWTALKHVLVWTRNLLLIFFLGQGFQFGGSIIALGITYIAYAMPVPGALGVQEIMQSLLFSQFGWGAERGAAFSFIFRGAELFVVAFGVIIILRMATILIAWRLYGGINGNHTKPKI